MKVILAFLFAAVVCAQAINDEDVLKQWSEFQETYGKTYRSPLEARKRLEIFKNNLKKIEEHNVLFEQGKTTYTEGVNQFADWSTEEFMDYVNKGLINKPKITGTIFKSSPGFVAPKSIDWRTKNAVTHVKNQFNCGSCWAFSTTGSLEGQLGIKGKLVSLSDEMLVDCSEDNHGCHGGLMTVAFEYIKKNGIESEVDYPYYGAFQFCQANSSKIVTKISDYVNLPSGNDAALLEAVATKGPISVALWATEKLKQYRSGILDDNTCTNFYTNHGVLLVGYGSENGEDYYIIKNSWGAQWGENGYYRMTRRGENVCGISSMASYPVL